MYDEKSRGPNPHTVRVMFTFLPKSQGHCIVIQQSLMAPTPTQHSATENKVHGAQKEGNVLSTYLESPGMWLGLRILQIPPHVEGFHVMAKEESRSHKRQP